MAVFRLIVAGCVALALCAEAQAAPLKKSFRNDNPEFDASKFNCLSYTSGLAPNSTSRANAIMARIWMFGFLDGFYSASEKLERSDDPADVQKVDEAIIQGCQSNPGASIYLMTAQGVTKETYKLPTMVSAGLSVSYTCGEHMEAKDSGSMKADLAELWAFGVVEGAKAVANPELQIPISSKAAIMDAVNRSCSNAANKDKTYRDLAGAVADKVKMADAPSRREEFEPPPGAPPPGRGRGGPPPGGPPPGGGGFL